MRKREKGRERMKGGFDGRGWKGSPDKGGATESERVEEEEAKSLRGGRGGNPCGSNGGTGLWVVCVCRCGGGSKGRGERSREGNVWE